MTRVYIGNAINGGRKIGNPYRAAFNAILALNAVCSYLPASNRTVSGSNVTGITDASGNNNHAVQAVAGKQPTVVAGEVTFGASSYLDIPTYAGITKPTEYEEFFVGTITTLLATKVIMGSINPADPYNYQYHTATLFGKSATALYTAIGRQPVDTATRVVQTGDVIDGNLVMLSARTTSGVSPYLGISKNGVDLVVTSAAGFATAPAGTTYNVGIGCEFSNGSAQFTYKASVWVPFALTAAQRLTVFNFLKYEYGVV